MTEPRGRVSTKTKIWFFLMKIFKLRKPKLFSYEELLPHQHVPPLKKTVENYINSCKATKTKDELVKLRQHADDFLKSVGPKLQLNLEHNSWTEENYITEWWTKSSYLSFTDSLLKLNFFGGGLLNPPTSRMTSRAAMIVDGYLKIYQEISAGKFKPPLLQNMIPLCTDQYRRFLATSRIPSTPVDSLKSWPASNHIAINHRHRWYIIDIEHDNCVMRTGEKNHRLNAKELEIIFDKIVQHGDLEGIVVTNLELNLAKVTGGNRGDWSSIRSAIINGSTRNEKCLELIESAILHITLEDEAEICSDGEINPTKLCYQLCTGGGKRWFDKSASLVVFQNGAFGAGYDHSWGDGAVTMNVYEKVIERERSEGYGPDGRIIGTAQLKLDPRRLLWENDEDIVSAMQPAVRHFNDVVDDIDLLVFEAPIGKDSLKQLKVSPDAFIQACLQLAHYRHQKRFVLTYEAAVTLLFKHGRYVVNKKIYD